MAITVESFDALTCAFCRSEVPHGASVCAHCGAFKGVKADAGGYPLWPSIVLMAFGGILFFGGFGHEPDFEHVYRYDSWGMISTGLVSFLIGASFFYYAIRRGFQKTWLRRN